MGLMDAVKGLNETLGGPRTELHGYLNKTLSKDNALPGQAYHPKEVADLNAEQLKRGEDFYTDKQNYGIGEPALAQESSNDPMVQALQGNYDKEYKQEAEGLKTRNSMNSTMMQASQRGEAASQLGTQRSNEIQNFNQQYAFQLKRKALYNAQIMAQDKADAAVIGTIFSGGLSLVGNMLGGGKKED